MLNCKKILCAALVLLYSMTLLDTGFVEAARSSKRKSSKKKTKSKGKSKSSKSRASAKSSTATETTEEVEETASVATTAETTTATAEVSASVANTAETTTNTTETDTSTVEDVSKDSEWENFRICMQSSCSGGDDQPPNVQCYRSVNFDNAFTNCKGLVSEEKRNKFKEYFKGPFTTLEKQTACEDSLKKGKWKDGKCVLTVTYTRGKISNKCLDDCSPVNKSKEWIVDGRNYLCSADTFGVEMCYKDSPNCEAAKSERIGGYIALATAGISAGLGVMQGISTASVSRTETVEDKEAKAKKASLINKGDSEAAALLSDTKEVTRNYSSSSQLKKEYGENSDTYKDLKSELNRKKAIGATTEALNASSGQFAEAASSLVSARIHSKEKGEAVYGTCLLPDGTRLPNGSSIKLDW